jgi:hypothetical protein
MQFDLLVVLLAVETKKFIGGRGKWQHGDTTMRHETVVRSVRRGLPEKEAIL